MLEIIVKIFCALLYSLLNFYVMKKMLLSDEKLITKKNIILLLILALSYIFTYNTEYSIEPMIQRFLFGIVIDCIIFDKPLYKILVAYIIHMMLTLIADILNTVIYMQIIPAEYIRTNNILVILTNCTVAITLYLMLKIKPLTTKLQQLINTLKENSNIETIIFYLLVYIMFITMFYKILSIYKINYQNIINYIIVIITFGVLLIYTINRLNYHNLEKEYDTLFNYVQEFEDTIDNMELNDHEYKNQLAILKNYIKDKSYKKALNIVDEMSDESYKQDNSILLQLKNIPKGGVKGLLYYKILVAKNKGVNLSVDISKNVSNTIKKIELDKIKILCKLIGIYLDNAIESCIETNKKLLSVEVYMMDDKLEFVFSNNFNREKLDINKFGNKGYTTKGKGHGRGLYLSKKLLAKNEWIKTDTKIMNNMYVQKIILKKDSV